MQLRAIVRGDFPCLGAATTAVRFRYQTFRKNAFVIKKLMQRLNNKIEGYNSEISLNTEKV